MLDRFNQHLLNKFPNLIHSKLLVAISGGIDSVVLTHLLTKLNIQIALVHVNFLLRADESTQDEFFVKQLANDLGLPALIHKEDTQEYAKENKLSIQMAAREIRYNWFDKLVAEEQYDYVVTAHHQDDTIETFFINLSRSSGIDGLIGIPEKNGHIVRPLLAFSRAEIVNFAKENDITWREDASNAATKYLRNQIRHELIPVLNSIYPEFTNAIHKTQSHLKDTSALVQDYISLVKPKVWSNQKSAISLKALKKFPNYNAILYELLKDYGFTAWDDVYALVDAQTGKQIFSNTHFLLKNRESLVLGLTEIHETKSESQEISLARGAFKIKHTTFKISLLKSSKTLDFKPKTLNEIYFDKNKINFPIHVRKWKKGDYFYPLGMRGKKKLSDFFIDQKIARREKEKIYLLCDANDCIIWIIGYRLDNRYSITEKTTEIIKISPIKPNSLILTKP